MPHLRFRLFSLLWLGPLLGAAPAFACQVCRPKVQAGIHNVAYGRNLLLVLLPVAVLLAAGLGLFFLDRLTPTRPSASYAAN